MSPLDCAFHDIVVHGHDVPCNQVSPYYQGQREQTTGNKGRICSVIYCRPVSALLGMVLPALCFLN